MRRGEGRREANLQEPGRGWLYKSMRQFFTKSKDGSAADPAAEVRGQEAGVDADS
jgi:hypothetical protein